MKKTKFLAVLLALSMLLGQIGFSNKYLEQEKVIMLDVTNNKVDEYFPMNVIVRGRDLISDTPSVAIDGVSLVPVISVVEALEFKYDYNAEKKQITFDSTKGEVVLTIGEQYATVGGVKTKLPGGVHPRVFAYKTQDDWIYRTYVPLRFVAETLGMQVDYISDSRTAVINYPRQDISSIELDYQTRYPEIKVKTTGRVDVRAFDIAGKSVGAKDQIIVDFQSSVLNVKNMKDGVYVHKIEDQIFGLNQFKFVQLSKNPYVVRLTIDQNERKGYDVKYDEKKNEIVIRLLNSVNKFESKQIYGADALVFETSVDPMINTSLDGDLVTIDLIDSISKLDKAKYEIDSAMYKTIEFRELTKAEKVDAQYNPERHITRITAKLKKNVDRERFFVEAEKDNVVLYVSEKKINNFSYTVTKADTSKITMGTNGAATPVVDLDKEKNILKLNFKVHDLDFQDFKNIVSDGILNDFEVEKTDSGYTLTASMAEGTIHRVDVNNGSVVVNFVNERIKLSPYRNTIVVIDAGHGGHDPGAVGSKVYEKVLALKASKRLQKRLEEAGFKVLMTRMDDVYMQLSARSSIANNVGADLFVSVHINAHNSKKASGIETLYGTEKERLLATHIQKEMIAVSGAINRGVVRRPELYVIRNTKMPAVLCELGFLSNEDDQARLLQDSYLYSLSDAISRGIKKYIDPTLEK